MIIVAAMKGFPEGLDHEGIDNENDQPKHELRGLEHNCFIHWEYVARLHDAARVAPVNQIKTLTQAEEQKHRAELHHQNIEHTSLGAEDAFPRRD